MASKILLIVGLLGLAHISSALAEARECSAARIALKSEAKHLATTWAKPSHAMLRIDSAGRRSTRPTPVQREKLDRQIAVPELIHTMEISDPSLLRVFSEELSEVEWEVVERPSPRLDLRYRVTLHGDSGEAVRLYVAQNEDVLFGDCVLRATRKGWFGHLWDIAVARETYAP